LYISPNMSLKRFMQQADERFDEEAMSESFSMTETSMRDLAVSKAPRETPIAQHETKAVNRSRLLVYLAILVTAAAAVTATYFFMSGEEQDDFESEVRYICSGSYCNSIPYSLLTIFLTIDICRSSRFLPRSSLPHQNARLIASLVCFKV
jgi:hypothetical protein